jgi:membrane-bound lytic murein transglycosylase B
LSRRGRHRKRSRTAFVASRVAVVAVAACAGGAQIHSGAHAPVSVADVSSIGPAAPLAPFAAAPLVVSLDATSPIHYVKDLPPLVALRRARPHHVALPPANAATVTLPVNLDLAAAAIPKRVLEAYVNAVKLADRSDPRCGLQWQTLAGIGFIESGNARSGGSANPRWDGVAYPPILGPVLDGTNGNAAEPDTDGGTLDGNPTWDRAVGPMQFIPSTWARFAADGNHDGAENPQDIDDASLAAADYLCATGSDLSETQPRIRAIYAYNHSYIYVRDVLTVAAHYAGINPAKLGINGLPKPHHKNKHKHHGKRHHGHQHHGRGHGGHPTPSPSPSVTATSSPSSSPSSSPTAQPSASPTSSPTPTPMPSSPPPADPTPTPTPIDLPSAPAPSPSPSPSASASASAS